MTRTSCSVTDSAAIPGPFDEIRRLCAAGVAVGSSGAAPTREAWMHIPSRRAAVYPGTLGDDVDVELADAALDLAMSAQLGDVADPAGGTLHGVEDAAPEDKPRAPE